MELLKYSLALTMMLAGVMHFVSPKFYLRIMPPWLPAPKALVLVSGFFEAAGGAGLLLPMTQRLAAWGLIALFLAVFPANVYQAVQKIPFGKRSAPWVAWARLPFQAVFVAWAWAFT